MLAESRAKRWVGAYRSSKERKKKKKAKRKKRKKKKLFP